MRSRVFLLLWISLFSAQAEDVEVGFFRLVNLVDQGEGRLSFSIDGENIYPQGYRCGQLTGAMGRRLGKYEVVAEKQGCKRAKMSLKLVKGETQSLVAYAVPRENRKGEIEWEIEFVQLKQFRLNTGRILTVISFCRDKELKVDVVEQGERGEVQLVLKRKKAKRLILKTSKGAVLLKYTKKKAWRFSFDEEGSHVLLIYDKKTGAKAAVSFSDRKVVKAG